MDLSCYVKIIFFIIFSSANSLLVPDAICPSLMVKHLTKEVIENQAFSSGHFKRGEGCTKLIRNVKSTMVEDGMQFTGQCEYGLHLFLPAALNRFTDLFC